MLDSPDSFKRVGRAKRCASREIYIARGSLRVEGAPPLAMKRVHEGLNNYIKSLKGPGGIGVPNVQPRLPLGPDAPLPGGLRPIPASSQAPKKTNSTIVYARTAVNSNRDDEFGRVRASNDVAGVSMAIREGDLVFTLRAAPATRAPLGQNVKSFSLRRVNEILKNEADDGAQDAQRTHLQWCPDGVCHNLDGEDPHHEFKDFALDNVSLHGFTRFSTLPLTNPLQPTTAQVRNTDRILVALVAPEPGRFEFRLFHVAPDHHAQAALCTLDGGKGVDRRARRGRQAVQEYGDHKRRHRPGGAGSGRAAVRACARPEGCAQDGQGAGEGLHGVSAAAAHVARRLRRRGTQRHRGRRRSRG